MLTDHFTNELYYSILKIESMMNEEKISITEIAKRYPNLTVSLTYTELVEAFRDILIEENLKNKLLFRFLLFLNQVFCLFA